VKTGLFLRISGWLAFAGALAAPLAAARADSFERDFDKAFATQSNTGQSNSGQSKAPRAALATQPQARRLSIATVQPFVPANAPRAYGNGLEEQLAMIAGPDRGRIGVAAIDLATGRSVTVMGDQPFPMASTSKIAIVATFLQMVDDGRYRLTDPFPLMVPVRSAKYSSTAAPVRPGAYISAQGLIELTITRSDNQATDALLAAVGGPGAVNRWLRHAGLSGLRLDRDIATLVRDDGEYDPATTIDQRDSTTPQAMVQLLSGLYQGRWLTASSRSVLLGAMERCVTGKRRIPGLLPEDARIQHKTGTLSNTASDVGIIHTPDGRAIAIAIYVTGQGGKANRDARIASIARTVYDGYHSEAMSMHRSASR
jgi:beta-lactamase class A